VGGWGGGGGGEGGWRGGGVWGLVGGGWGGGVGGGGGGGGEGGGAAVAVCGADVAADGVSWVAGPAVLDHRGGRLPVPTNLPRHFLPRSRVGSSGPGGVGGWGRPKAWRGRAGRGMYAGEAAGAGGATCGRAAAGLRPPAATAGAARVSRRCSRRRRGRGRGGCRAAASACAGVGSAEAAHAELMARVGRFPEQGTGQGGRAHTRRVG
jgi:hypothetical protein